MVIYKKKIKMLGFVAKTGAGKTDFQAHLWADSEFKRLN